MKSETSRLRSTGTIDNDIGAIWTDALLVVYLGATSVLLLVGVARVPAGALAAHVLVLAAFVACVWMPAVPAWLRRWAPLLALLFLYGELPSLILAAGHGQLFDATVMRWEQGLFGAQPSRAWAEQFPSELVSEPLHFAYLSYYAIIVVVPLVLFAQRRAAEFDVAVFALLVTFLACCLAYVIFPVAGPRYEWPAREGGGVIRAIVLSVLDAGSSRGTAFPSSHVAVATTQSILALRYFGWRGVIVTVLSVGIAAGAVYGGFHYAVDVLAGAALGALTTWAALVAVRWLPRSRAQANAIAPTY